MKLWAMRLMLREDRFCTPFAIGERIILGIGVPLLQIVGGSQEMCMILGINLIQDVPGMYFLLLSILKHWT
jgi:gamma-glutamyl-gamma-aminobutyrate hydrolase PuuD